MSNLELQNLYFYPTKLKDEETYIHEYFARNIFTFCPTKSTQKYV
jgi:hypothetical protein